jgi:hypothetical protein
MARALPVTLSRRPIHFHMESATLTRKTIPTDQNCTPPIQGFHRIPSLIGLIHDISIMYPSPASALTSIRIATRIGRSTFPSDSQIRRLLPAHWGVKKF